MNSDHCSYIPDEETGGYAINVSRKGARITVEWAVDDVGDVERARELFSDLTRQGWLAVLVLPSDRNDRRILEFKPDYGRLRFVPLLEGG